MFKSSECFRKLITCLTKLILTTDEHDHDHDHGHTHEGRYEVEATALEREGAADRAGQVVGEALLRVLYKKGE